MALGVGVFCWSKSGTNWFAGSDVDLMGQLKR